MARVDPVDDERELRAAYARACAPDPSRRRHNWNATLARLDEAPLVEVEPARPRRLGVWLVAAGLAAAIGLGGVQAVRLMRGERAVLDQASDRAPPAASRTTSVVPAEPPRAPRSVDVEPTVPAPAITAPQRPAPPSVREATERPGPPSPASAPAPVQRPAPSAPDRLALETRLLGRARAAVERHDDAAAIRLLRQHAREFPDGALVEDRSAWLAIVQCRRSAPGSAASGAAFVAAHPRSPYVAEIERVCEHED